MSYLSASWAASTLPWARCLRCNHFPSALLLHVQACVTVYTLSDVAFFGLKFECLETRRYGRITVHSHSSVLKVEIHEAVSACTDVDSAARSILSLSPLVS